MDNLSFEVDLRKCCSLSSQTLHVEGCSFGVNVRIKSSELNAVPFMLFDRYSFNIDFIKFDDGWFCFGLSKKHL